MVVDVIFDNICRCFGSATPRPSEDGHQGSSAVSSDVKQRLSDRVLFKEKQLDALLEGQHNADLEHANAVAKAKLAAGKSKKRKSPSTMHKDIFRSRDFAPKQKPTPPSNSFGRFLSNHQQVANALCFATPVHDEDDAEANDILKTESDCNTLNTCEDTITSTQFFERKYAHLVESRPPMPLFSAFKVDNNDDELRRIVAADSHNSLKMMHLLEDIPSDSKMELEESEDEPAEEEDLGPDDEVPTALKIDSSASSSSSSRR